MMTKRLLLGMLAAIGVVVLVLGAEPASRPAEASQPGTDVVPLLSCPDVHGDGQVDLIEDILAVANHFGAQEGDARYHPLFDVKDANGIIDLFEDILYMASRYGEVCPMADRQVAKATMWGIENLPMNEDSAALEALDYYRASFDVPGQGVHYTKVQNWDGVFDPEAPEGLVYNDGRLVAQLYVVEGSAVGWGTHEATSYPPPAVPHEVDLEGDADGPQCNPACSWAGGYDGWHLHYYLCTTDIGTPQASALPGFSTKQACASFGGGDPECTIPITVTPCYRWSRTVGWMGHLWNHQLNENLIPDAGGENGRFADCAPDGGIWKEFNCPA